MVLAVGLFMAAGTIASAQDEHLPDGIPYFPSPPSVVKRYGSHVDQRLQFTKGKKAGAAIAVVVGSSTGNLGGTSLRDLLFDKGLAVVDIRYRNPVRFGAGSAATDVALAILFLREHADQLHIDGNRIALLGSGPDAAWAALLGCNPEIFKQVGVPFSAIRTVALIDGDGIDAPSEVLAASAPRSAALKKLFGQSSNEQATNSAVGWVGGENAPDFFLVSSEFPAFRRKLTQDFGDKLRHNGTKVEIRFIAGASSVLTLRNVGRKPAKPVIELIDHVATRLED
jgi:acetyl esterase/lipase